MKAKVTRATYDIRFAHFNVDGRRYRKLRKDEEIRKDGEVTVRHVSARKTHCLVRNSKRMGLGVARCHPNDKFDLVQGRKVALGRALKAAGLSKRARELVWRQYLGS